MVTEEQYNEFIKNVVKNINCCIDFSDTVELYHKDRGVDLIIHTYPGQHFKTKIPAKEFLEHSDTLSNFAVSLIFLTNLIKERLSVDNLMK